MSAAPPNFRYRPPLSRWLLIAVCLAGMAISAPAHAQGGCIVSSRDDLSLTVQGRVNATDAAPVVIATTGGRLELVGRAHHVEIAANCALTDTAIDPRTFSLAFRANGSVTVQDITASLQPPVGFGPSFTPLQPGTYAARMTAGSASTQVRIEVVPQGRSWFSLGPAGYAVPSLGWGVPDTGRVNALAFDPSSPGTVYAGSALGGIFKSDDRGESWCPISDDEGFPTLGVSALAVSPDGIAFAGTGDYQFGTTRAPHSQDGRGIWRSMDGGDTWQQVGASVGAFCPPGSVPFTGLAYRIVVSPETPTTVHVAARRGGYPY